jgi:ubiquinone/menaquinone biosynthesis C-methylase UbiE
MTQWQLQGNAAEFYERWPAQYVLGPWAPALLEAAGLRAGDDVLDVACGTGVVARLAARSVQPDGRVVGLDLNPGMVAVARALPLPPGITVDWREGSALALPFDAHTFDAVVCQQGLQFFPDRPRALREMLRVLRPGGRVAVSVWSQPTAFNLALRDALKQWVSVSASETMATAQSLTDVDEVKQLVDGAGFADVVVKTLTMITRLPPLDDFVPGQVAAAPVAREVAAAGAEALASIVRDVKAAMQPYVDGYGVTFPAKAHIATGRVPR